MIATRRLLVGAVALAVAASGCAVGADPSKGKGDAGVNYPQGTDARRANVIEFPDSFGNVAWKCEPGHQWVGANTHGWFQTVINPSLCP